MRRSRPPSAERESRAVDDDRRTDRGPTDRRDTNRRAFLAASAGALATLAGCAGGGAEESPTPTSTEAATATGTPTAEPASDDGDGLPDGVYVGRFDPGTSLRASQRAGPYEVAVLYAAPQPYWLVDGDEATERPVREGDDLYLAVLAWDAETGLVVPETDLSVELERAEADARELGVHPVLSQRLGAHHGGNVALDGAESFTVTVTVADLPIRATGAFEDRFDDPATASFDLSFDEADREALSIETPEDHGRRGAADPAEIDGLAAPLSSARIPGDLLGTDSVHDAQVVASVLTDDAPVGDRALAVYLRSPYNHLALPGARLSATLRRDGDAHAHLDLRRTLDPGAGYHHGAALETELRSGDELVVDVETPPQIARQEGYERAFLEMDPVVFTV